MYTVCGECETILPISSGELALAHGQVRCGCCGAVFFALDSLCEQLDENGQVRTCFHSERPPTLSDPQAGDAYIDDLFRGRSTPPLGSPPLIDDPDPPMPGELRTRRRARRPRSWAWAAASALLLAVLAGQWAFQERQQLIHNPELRPLLQRVCNLVGCRLPLASDLSMIRLAGRNIRPHPSVDGALIISAAMQNQAPLPQPYPEVEISLSNLQGRTVAMRRFEPRDYLDEDTSLAAGMPPQTLLPLVFEVIDPGEDAVAFEFTFR